MSVELLTSEELAERWSIHPGTLRNQRHRGVGVAFVRLGANCVRYRLADVLAFEEAHLVAPEVRR